MSSASIARANASARAAQAAEARARAKARRLQEQLEGKVVEEEEESDDTDTDNDDDDEDNNQRHRPTHPIADLDALRQAVAAALPQGTQFPQSRYTRNFDQSLQDSLKNLRESMVRQEQQRTGYNQDNDDDHEYAYGEDDGEPLEEQTGNTAALDVVTEDSQRGEEGDNARIPTAQLPHYHPEAPGTPWPTSPPQPSLDVVEQNADKQSQSGRSFSSSALATDQPSHSIPASSLPPPSSPAHVVVVVKQDNNESKSKQRKVATAVITSDTSIISEQKQIQQQQQQQSQHPQSSLIRGRDRQTRPQRGSSTTSSTQTRNTVSNRDHAEQLLQQQSSAVSVQQQSHDTKKQQSHDQLSVSSDPASPPHAVHPQKAEVVSMVTHPLFANAGIADEAAEKIVIVQKSPDPDTTDKEEVSAGFISDNQTRSQSSSPPITNANKDQKSLKDRGATSGASQRETFPMAIQMSRKALKAYLATIEIPPPKHRIRRKNLERKKQLNHLKSELDDVMKARNNILASSSPGGKPAAASQGQGQGQGQRPSIINDVEHEEEDVDEEEEYSPSIHSQGNIGPNSTNNGHEPDQLTQLTRDAENLMVQVNDLERFKEPQIELSFAGPKTKSIAKSRIDDELWTESTGKAPGIRRMSGFTTVYDTERTILTPVISECSEMPTLSPRSSITNLSMASSRSARSMRSNKSGRSLEGGTGGTSRSILQTLEEGDDQAVASMSNTTTRNVYQRSGDANDANQSQAVTAGSVATDYEAWQRDVDRWRRSSSPPVAHSHQNAPASASDLEAQSRNNINNINTGSGSNERKTNATQSRRHTSTGSVSTIASSTQSRPAMQINPTAGVSTGDAPPESTKTSPHDSVKSGHRKPPAAMKTRHQTNSAMRGDEWHGHRSVAAELQAARSKSPPPQSNRDNTAKEQRPISPQQVPTEAGLPAPVVHISPPSPSVNQHDGSASPFLRDYDDPDATAVYPVQISPRAAAAFAKLQVTTHAMVRVSSKRATRRPKLSQAELEARRAKEAIRAEKEKEKAARYHKRHLAIDAKRAFQDEKDDLHARLTTTRNEDARAEIQWELGELYAAYAYGEAKGRNGAEVPALGASALQHASRLMYEALYSPARKEKGTPGTTALSRDPAKWLRYGQVHLVLWSCTESKSHLEWAYRAFPEALKFAGDKTEKAGELCALVAQWLQEHAGNYVEVLFRSHQYWLKSVKCDCRNSKVLAWRYMALAHVCDILAVQSVSGRLRGHDPVHWRRSCVDAIERAYSLDPANTSYLDRLRHYKDCQAEELESLESTEEGTGKFEELSDNEQTPRAADAAIERARSAPLVLEGHKVEMIEHSLLEVDTPEDNLPSVQRLSRYDQHHQEHQSIMEEGSDDDGGDYGNDSDATLAEPSGSQPKVNTTSRVSHEDTLPHANQRQTAPSCPEEPYQQDTKRTPPPDNRLDESASGEEEDEEEEGEEEEAEEEVEDEGEGGDQEHEAEGKAIDPSVFESEHQYDMGSPSTSATPLGQPSATVHANLATSFIEKPVQSPNQAHRPRLHSAPPEHPPQARTGSNVRDSNSAHGHAVETGQSYMPPFLMQTLQEHHQALMHTNQVLQAMQADIRAIRQDMRSAQSQRHASEQDLERRMHDIEQQSQMQRNASHRHEADLSNLRTDVNMLRVRMEQLESQRDLQQRPTVDTDGEQDAPRTPRNHQMPFRTHRRSSSSQSRDIPSSSRTPMMDSEHRPRSVPPINTGRQSTTGQSDDPPPSFHSRGDGRYGTHPSGPNSLPNSYVPLQMGETFETFDKQAMLERGALLFGLYSLHQLARQTGLQTPLFPQPRGS